MATSDPATSDDTKPKPSKLAVFIRRLMRRPGIAHLIRAMERYGDRLGSQFAGAITYFSFLSMIPILMVAFSVVGFVLAGNPELVQEIADKIAAQLPGELGASIATVIDTAISSRLSIGIIGLLIALYSGIGWMGNVRNAVRAQWRPTFEEPDSYKDNFVVALLKNLVNLAGLGLAILASIAITTFAGSAQNWTLGLFGLQDEAWLKPVLWFVSVIVSIAAGTLIFYWLYSRLPGPHYRPTSKALWRGALAAAVVFEILKFALVFILPKVTSTPTAAIFGSVIGLLFFFNLVSQMLLIVAAWIATSSSMQQKAALPEIPGPPAIARGGVGTGEALGLVGVGAVAGWVTGRWKERHRT